MKDKDRDDKLEQIARNCLGIEDLELQPDMAEVTACLVDIKTALQLAYKFGKDTGLELAEKEVRAPTTGDHASTEVKLLILARIAKHRSK